MLFLGELAGLALDPGFANISDVQNQDFGSSLEMSEERVSLAFRIRFSLDPGAKLKCQNIAEKCCPVPETW